MWGTGLEKINLQKKRGRNKMSHSSPSGPGKSPGEEQIRFDGLLQPLDIPEAVAGAGCLVPGAPAGDTSDRDTTRKH